MVNTSMTHVFKHPKFYRIPRDKSDQAIRLRAHDGECERASDPGLKLKETSCPDDKNPNPQASSDKLQAPSRKHQAPSRKRQAP